MPNDAAERRRMRRAVWASGLCAALYMPLAFGFFGHLHHSFDLFAHFRQHLAVLLAIAAVFALSCRAFAMGIVGLAAAAFGLLTTLGVEGVPLSGPPRVEMRPASPGEAVYTLLQINLRYDNPTPEKALSLIGRVKPDIVTLDEVSPRWAEKLALIKSAYPQQIVCPTWIRIGGGAVLSRRPFTGDEACADRGTFATATVDLGGRALKVAALHLDWPWPAGQWWQIRRLVPTMEQLGPTAIAAGDFNATSWSAAVDRMAEAGGMRLVGPVGATWLDRRLPIWLRRWLGLEIDHVLVKGGVAVHRARILDDVGSDHAPVLIEFSVEAPGDAPPAPVRTVGSEASATASKG